MSDVATVGRVLREQARFIEEQESLRTKADVVQYLLDVARLLEQGEERTSFSDTSSI